MKYMIEVMYNFIL